MNKILIGLSAGLMAASLPALAQPGGGNGNGNGPDKAKGSPAAAMERGGGKPDRGPAMNDRGDKPDKAAMKGNPGNNAANGQGKPSNNAAKDPSNRSAQAVRADDRDWKNRGKDMRNDYANRDRDEWRRPERRVFKDTPFEINENGRRVAYYDNDGNPGLIDGCPPGLAKKNNGCQPPGQARKRDDYYNWFDRFGYNRDGRDYYYRDGYLLDFDRGNLLGYLPLLGGALREGAPFPTNYASYPVSDYVASYYGDRDDDYIYRYSDGVLYGLDPQSRAISEVVGLLTGDNFTIGQPVPAGYSVYNVPAPYRDRYADGPNARYRYSDGYIYQIDPTTQLVRAAIQLLS